jgi:hypothetical protein
MNDNRLVVNIFRGCVAGIGAGMIVFSGYHGLLSWRILAVFGAMVLIGVFPFRLFKRKKAEVKDA